MYVCCHRQLDPVCVQKWGPSRVRKSNQRTWRPIRRNAARQADHLDFNVDIQIQGRDDLVIRLLVGDHETILRLLRRDTRGDDGL